jgi:hypothetical protein
MQGTMSAPAAELSAFNLDRKLVANVQAHAGARCHEAAGLLFAYHLSAEVLRDAGGTSEALEAQASLDRAERELRRFLARRRGAWLPSPACVRRTQPPMRLICSLP